MATGGVGAAQLVRPICAVSDSVAKEAGGQAARRLLLPAREVAIGAEAGLAVGGWRRAGPFVGGVATLVVAVAPPDLRKALPVVTQELPVLAEALTQLTCGGQSNASALARRDRWNPPRLYTGA